ncbi:MAG: MFS transporter, partial [Cytophagaceae bacterium]
MAAQKHFDTLQSLAMEATRSAIQSFRSSTAFITFVIAYAVFTDQFLFAAIIPVYPYSLQERTGVSKERVQFWVAILLGVFGIACVLISVPWGWYTDRTKSRRTPFTIGLLILLGATLLLWFTTTLARQIVGRALQGISSAVVWT